MKNAIKPHCVFYRMRYMCDISSRLENDTPLTHCGKFCLDFFNYIFFWDCNFGFSVQIFQFDLSRIDLVLPKENHKRNTSFQGIVELVSHFWIWFETEFTLDARFPKVGCNFHSLRLETVTDGRNQDFCFSFPDGAISLLGLFFHLGLHDGKHSLNTNRYADSWYFFSAEHANKAIVSSSSSYASHTATFEDSLINYSCVVIQSSGKGQIKREWFKSIHNIQKVE
mmetsp:Transcript_5669/g.11116  ORF Transcript_5669/g.11116 Transcript_5669/m.11116 type:complete len:225 (-) Transcript_5669:2273-2947(-)